MSWAPNRRQAAWKGAKTKPWSYITPSGAPNLVSPVPVVIFMLSCFSSVWLHGLQSTMFLCAWNSPAKNIEVGCHFLLQGIFPTQGSTHTSYVSCTGSRFFTTDAHLKFFQFFLFLLVNHLLNIQLGWVGRKRERKETSYLSCTRCKALS